MSELHTTLRCLRDHGLYYDRYAVVREALGPDWGNETPIPLSRILASNGIFDTVWAFRALIDEPGWTRKYILDCAERVLPIWQKHHPNNGHPRRAIETARAFLRGQASKVEVVSAASAVYKATLGYADTAAAARAVYTAACYVTFGYEDSAVTAIEDASYVSPDAATERKWQASRFLEYCMANA